MFLLRVELAAELFRRLVSEGSRKEINLGPQIANQEWDVGSILLRETVGRDSREEQVLRLVSPGN